MRTTIRTFTFFALFAYFVSSKGGTVTVYFSLHLQPGLNLIGVPLQQGDNFVGDLFRNAEIGTEVSKYENGSFVTNRLTADGWTIPDQRILIGEGAFVLNPSNKVQTVTLSGQAPTGAVTYEIPIGLSLITSKKPAVGPITSKLRLQLSPFDNLYLWETNRFKVFTFLPDASWDPGEPQLSLGKGFIVRAAASTNWIIE